MKKLLFLLLIIPEISLYALKAVVFMPSHAEIACEIGACHEIAAVGAYCDWPAELEKKEKVGDYFKPNIEKIYSIKPDFVLLGYSANSTTAPDIRKLGIKVIELEPEKNFSDLYRNIIIISDSFNRHAEGKDLVKKIKKSLNHKRKNKLKKVFFEIDSGFWTAGSESFINSEIELAGGKNIFSDRKESYFKVSWETIVSMNPEVIISNHSEPSYFKSLPLSQKIDAVKNGKVFKLSPSLRDMLVRPGPRTPKAVKELAEIIQ